MNFDTRYYIGNVGKDVNFPNNNLFTDGFNKLIVNAISKFIDTINIEGLDVLLKLGGAKIAVIDNTLEKIDITIWVVINNVIYKKKIV